MPREFWLLIAFMQLEISISNEISICTTLICPDLSDYNINCNNFENHIDCLHSVNLNESQLGYAPPFESILATQLLPNLELVGEVRSEANSSQWLYEIVVLTNKPASNFEELENFSYCTQEIGDVPEFAINGLEGAILKNYKSPRCRTKISLAEEQACNLNEFFGPSCRAGAFKYNTDGRDTRTDYTKLFQLCPEDCTAQNGCASGYPEDECLQLKHGAVTITTLFNAATMWRPNLYYLCQNGSTSSTPCVWYRQPWPLIFTHKSLRQSITTKLDELLSICAVPGEAECLKTLGEILTATNEPYISVLGNETHGIIPTLQPYDLSGFTNNKAIRWCTISDVEYEQCNWLKAFSGTLIYPIECILRDSKALCLSAIQNYEADIVQIVGLPITDSLSPIAFSTTPLTFFKEQRLLLDALSNREIEAICSDKYYYVNSSMYLIPNSSYKFCPNGRYRLICTNGTKEVCHFHKEVIMRIDDPNRENAKLVLGDLLLIFAKISKTRSSDFFGCFNDVFNWLLQCGTSDIYYIFQNEKEFEVEEDDASASYLLKSLGGYRMRRVIRFFGVPGTIIILLNLAILSIACCYICLPLDCCIADRKANNSPLTELDPDRKVTYQHISLHGDNEVAV